jgi:LCP family protein required for cell wall assembly
VTTAVKEPDGTPQPTRRAARSRRRRLIPARRWPRRILVTVNVLVAVSLVSAGVVYGYVRYRLSQLKTVKLPSLTAPAPSSSGGSGGLPAMNILLVGSNTRTGLDPGEAAQFGSATDVPGARSDVTMILHLNPANNTASLLSIPRDLFVPLPAHSMAGSVGKIDAALNDGPNNLITAITDDLGIPINHYIEINFDGFQRTIDAIGGISMNFPMPLRDTFSSLKILQTGCVHLNGATALAVVRARHLQYYTNGRWNDDPLSDLARIRRDHTFLRIFVNAAKGQLTNPLRINALVGGLLNQVTVDSGLNVNTLLSLLRHYRHLDPNAVPETTLPITVVSNYRYGGGSYGDVDMPVEPLDHQVINAWAGQAPSTAAPSSTSVQLVNVSGVARKAATVGEQLSALGYHVTSSVTGRQSATTTETVIGYHPGSAAEALGVMGNLSGAVMLNSDPTVPAGTVTIQVGSLLAVTAPAATPTASPAPAAGSSTPSTLSPSTLSPSTSTATGPSSTTGGATATTIPVPTGQAPSSAVDQPAPYDPTACS